MKEKKDILFLCQYFYPEYVSSATLPFETALALSNSGFTVGALCGYPKEYTFNNKVPIEEVYDNIYIKRLKYIQLKRSNIFGRLINYFSFIVAVLLNLKHIKKYKVVIVYSNPPILPFVAAIANKLYKTKIVFVSYDIYPEIAYVTKVISSDSLISKVMKFINNYIFKRLHTVVALSNEMKNYLLEHRPFLVDNQVEVIPNWYEDKGKLKSKEFVNNKLFDNLIKNGNNFVVSYFGNLGTAQDIETIIETIRCLKDINNIKFLFAGHGNKLPMLKKIIREENLHNVNIYDFLHDNDFYDALSVSDCFIVSLAKGVTGLAVPSKTYSYMMAGKPIIAILDEDSDIARDLLNNKCGFVIQSGEVKKMVDIIKDLKSDLQKCKYMGENCRKVFLKKYNKVQCTQKYVKLMKRILED